MGSHIRRKIFLFAYLFLIAPIVSVVEAQETQIYIQNPIWGQLEAPTYTLGSKYQSWIYASRTDFRELNSIAFTSDLKMKDNQIVYFAQSKFILRIKPTTPSAANIGLFDLIPDSIDRDITGAMLRFSFIPFCTVSDPSSDSRRSEYLIGIAHKQYGFNPATTVEAYRYQASFQNQEVQVSVLHAILIGEQANAVLYCFAPTKGPMLRQQFFDIIRDVFGSSADLKSMPK